MRWGFSSSTLPRAVGSGRVGARDLLRLASQAGAGAVQLSGSLSPLVLPDLPDLLAEAGDLGIVVEPAHWGLDPEALVRLLEVAVRSGSEFVALGIPRPGYDRDIGPILGALEPVVARYRRAGVGLAIENGHTFPAPQTREICERLGPGTVGVALDTGNSCALMEPETVAAEILGGLVMNLHAKDFVVRRKPDFQGFDIVGAECGRGWVRWEEVLGRCGPDLVSITLEQWPTSDEEEARWLDPSSDFLAGLVRRSGRVPGRRV